MANRRQLQRRFALRRKLHVLKNLTKSKSLKKSSIIKDAFLYIYKLKLRLEAIKQEYLLLMHQIQEVKVEKLGEGRVVVRVACKRGQDMLVSMLEVFEEMGLEVVQVRVTCDHFFGMEAIVEAHEDQDLSDVTHAILRAIHNINM